MYLSKLTISQTVLLLICVPIIVEALSVFALLNFLREAESQGEREARVRYVIAQTYDLSILTFDAIGELVQYTLSPDRARLHRFELISGQTVRQVSKIKSILAESPLDPETMNSFERLARHFVVFYKEAERMFDSADTPLQRAVLGARVKILLNEILAENRKFMSELSQKTPELSEARVRAHNFVLIGIVMAMLAHVVVMLSLGLLVVREISKRIGVLVENTKRLRLGQELLSPLSNSDEIAFLDKEFHRMAFELEQANARRQEIISMVTHDLRTPITSIHLFLGRLKYQLTGSVVDEKLLQKLGRIEDTSQFVIQLVNDFLDMEKLKSGNFQVNLRNVEVSQVVSLAVSTVEPIAAAHSIELRLNCGSAGLIEADPDRLNQVLVNLISNAVKYSPPSSYVEIAARVAGGNCRIEVIDQGPGISKEQQGAIFDAFYQVHGTEKVGSTGLGLAISQKLVEMQGGKIGVDSILGKGSCFWIEFPSRN